MEVEERVGPYRLVRRLGQGGMGVVYLAESPEHQEVALKVLRPHVAHDATALARLEREVTTLQRVSHPGVAGIVDHDLQGDRPYLVTRFVPGRPLDELVEERGPLTPQRWLPLAGCLAEALQSIHQAGVVHRDLKPGNVMMLSGKPVLIDFGIAQAVDDLRLTGTGLVVGTPGYLAPELIEGEMVSESADWWGWAATVTFAATGRRPFGKGPFEVVLHRVRTGQADLKGVDPRLAPLLAAALAPNRGDRPTSTEILTGLNRYAEGRDALVPDPHPPTEVIEQSPSTMVLSAPTAVMTGVVPAAELPEPYDDPVAVANLIPPVIPPLSAFTPLRDKLRGIAAQQQAGGAAVPSHPATYSPAPGAAQPPAMPLTYQGAPNAAGPGLGLAVGPAASAPYPGQHQPYPAQPPYQPTGPYEPYQAHRTGPSYQAARGYQPYQPYQGGPPQGQPPGSRSAELVRRPSHEPATRSGSRPAARTASSHTGLLLGALVALTGLLAFAPGVGLVVVIALIVLARVIDRSTTSLMRRRQARGGPTRSDGMIAAAASPAHLLAATLVTAFCLIVPLVAGLTFGGLAAGGLAAARGLDWTPLSAATFAVAAFTGLLAAWWGPGGASLRRGTAIALRATVRPAWLSALLAVALAVAGLAGFVSAARGGGTDWARTRVDVPTLPSQPSLDGLRDAPFLRDLPVIGR